MCLYLLCYEYNGDLHASHARLSADLYDMVVCGAAGQPAMDLPYQLWGCSITIAHAIHLSSANVLVTYRHRV